MSENKKTWINQQKKTENKGKMKRIVGKKQREEEGEVVKEIRWSEEEICEV